jgi:glycosyltransferase involved in cell wall biosynthesis
MIVNNGMVGLRGHYPENAMALAEEAHRLGFDVALASHARCPQRSPSFRLPDWVAFYPIFRIDHSGSAVDPKVPSAFGLRADTKALRERPIGKVLDGTLSLTDYLLARFDPLPPPRWGGRLRHTLDHVLERLGLQGPSRARRLLPPLAYSSLGWLYQRRRHLVSAARHLTPPLLYEGMARLYQRSRRAGAAGPRVLGQLQERLAAAGAPHEFGLCRAFREDLERLLCLSGAGPDDHVYLATAHARDAVAVRQLIQDLGEERVPSFHLEYHHPLLALHAPAEADGEEPPGGSEAWMPLYTRTYEAYFDAFRAYPDTGCMRFYALTRGLADDYARLTGLPFRLQVLHFRADKVPPPAARSDGPLRVLYLGDCREEKGFLWLPGLVADLWEDYVRPGRARLVIQATADPGAQTPALQKALGALRAYDPRLVQLVGEDGYMPEEAFYRVLADADVVVLPYRKLAYRTRFSGIMLQAVLAGKPTAVTAGTWMAEQQAAGSGVAFQDEVSFHAAVRKVLDDYAPYRAAALRLREQWLERLPRTSRIAHMVSAAEPAA